MRHEKKIFICNTKELDFIRQEHAELDLMAERQQDLLRQMETTARALDAIGISLKKLENLTSKKSDGTDTPCNSKESNDVTGYKSCGSLYEVIDLTNDN